jgi:hypothetical protein
VTAKPIRLKALADTWVDARRPDTTFGSLSRLQVQGDERRAFLKFEVSELAGKEIRSAKLRLWVAKGNGMELTAYVADEGDWNKALTWNDQPGLGDELSDAKQLGTGRWVQFDVSGLVDGEGKYAFGIVSDDPVITSVGSADSSKRPALVLVLEDR